MSNSQYFRRAANAAMYARLPADRIEPLLTRAIELNPGGITPRVTLAQFYEREFDPPRIADAAGYYGQAVERNPNDLRLRLDYARLLRQLGQNEAAAEQLERVQELNDQLDPNEPERLSEDRLEELRQAVESLRAGS